MGDGSMEQEKVVLLQQLQSTDPELRELAVQQLWQLWFGAAGPEAEQRLLYSEQCFERQEYDEAERELSQLINDFPDFAEAWNRRATLRYLRNRFDDSLEDCREAVRLEPRHFGAWHGMGLCFIARRDFISAAHAFRRAIEIQPFTMTNQELLGQCLAKLN